MEEGEFEEYKEEIEKLSSPHKVELTLTCKDLADKDMFGKSDPYAVVYIKGEKDPIWMKLGVTETKQNDLNPHFDKVFTINYLFERNQIIRVEVFDKDDDTEQEASSDDIIGSTDCALNKLLVAPNQQIKEELLNGTHKAGRIYL